MAYDALFRSPAHEERYLAAYNTTLGQWPVPHEPLDVTTDYCTTHINAAGSPERPPLILLHGSALNSTQWYANVGPLSQHFRVYALDMLNHSGLTVPEQRITSPEECADWLSQVMEDLGIDRAAMVGHSFGGWTALNQAILAPDRVERMVLLAPAPAFAPVRWQLFARMMLPVVLPVRPLFYWMFQWTTTKPLSRPHILIEQFYTGIKSFKPSAMSIPVLSVFSDEALSQIRQPVLMLVGDHEVVYHPQAVLDRARRLIPHIEAELVKDAGHLLPIDQADMVNERMLTFLTLPS